MVEVCTLKDKIRMLRRKVEDEYLKEEGDKEKLLNLSIELDKLIFEYLSVRNEQTCL